MATLEERMDAMMIKREEDRALLQSLGSQIRDELIALTASIHELTSTLKDVCSKIVKIVKDECSKIVKEECSKIVKDECSKIFKDECYEIAKDERFKIVTHVTGESNKITNEDNVTAFINPSLI